MADALIAAVICLGCLIAVAVFVRQMSAQLQMRRRSKTQKYGLRVVGTSNYQDVLSNAAGGRSREGQFVPVLAKLRLDNRNKHDSNAVQVQIGGKVAGYLAKADALKYRGLHPPKVREVDAAIVGGWAKNQHDQGNFGVRLALKL